MLSAPADADPVPATGGCYVITQPNLSFVPGTGSLGQNEVETATLAACSSPLLPGIAEGELNVSFPRNDWATPPASGTVVWSNGQRSTISGTWGANELQTSTFAITSGPAAGHHLLLNGQYQHRGFYLTSATLAP